MTTGRTKIVFNISQSDWHEMSSEVMWASEVSGNKYKIENIPLYVYDVSFGDIVAVKKSSGNELIFDRVVIKSGNSTYRVLLRANVPRSEFDKRWQELEEMGCFYESSADPEDVFGINVPANADVHKVYSVLEKGQEDRVWHLDEGNFEHQV